MIRPTVLEWFATRARGDGGDVPRARPVDAGAVVRAADEHRVVAHRADHGDLGPRPGRVRRARARSTRSRGAVRQVATSGSARSASPSRRTGSSARRPGARRAATRRTATMWTLGDPAAADRVDGTGARLRAGRDPAPNLADTALVVDGPVADGVDGIAQAFAGPPGEGRGAEAGMNAEDERRGPARPHRVAPEAGRSDPPPRGATECGTGATTRTSTSGTWSRTGSCRTWSPISSPAGRSTWRAARGGTRSGSPRRDGP